MSQFPDLDVLKEIPGYQAILKAVLKSQIQLLVEQLSTQTGEESVILTASVTDGTLCHLGSDSGKVFIDDHEEFKSQFLGFCLKRHHKRKAQEEAVQRPGFDPGIPSLAKRRRTPEPYPQITSSPIHPVSLQKVGAARNVVGQRRLPSHTETHPINTSQSPSFTQEQSLFPTTDSIIKQEGDPMAVHDSGVPLAGNTGAQLQTGAPTSDARHSGMEQPEDGAGGDEAFVKTEPDEDDLEITGVELSNMSEGSQSGYEQWPSGAEGMGYGVNTSGGEGQSFDGGNQAYSNRYSAEYGEGTTEFQAPLGDGANMPKAMKKFVCPYCSREFSRKYDMKRHIRIHTGEKPYRCNICDKSFAVKSNMNTHKAVHMNFSRICVERADSDEK